MFLEKTRAAWNSARSLRWPRFVLTLVMGLTLMLLAGCGAGAQNTTGDDAEAAPSITLQELPEGLGRGFPMVDLAGVDNAETGLDQGDLAPNFQLVLDDGRQLSLHDLAGRPVLINFWATWCGPCRMEMPDIVELSEDDGELVVLAVNVMENQDAISAFVEEFQMSMPVVLDSDGDLRQLYEVRHMPTSVFIDRDGRIATIWAGFLTPDKMEEFVTPLSS